MKFTEGYWEKNELANAIYAAEAYAVEALPDRLRVVAPAKRVGQRGDTLNTGTITTEFTAPAENVIGVRSWHFEGYESAEPRFEKTLDPQPVHIEINEDEAVMTAGRTAVRINRKDFCITFEADGKLLTSCGRGNLGAMRYGRKAATKFPAANYLAEDYKPYMLTELSLGPGECVYGLGERFTAFVKNGQVVDMWNEDGGTSSQVAYKNIPFYVTNRRYGVFVDHASPVSFEVASEKVEYVGFSVPGEELRYFVVFDDTPAGVVSRYTALTGRPALPPAWSYGLWLTTSFTTSYDEATVRSFIDGMLERDIPLHVFHFDCFWMKEFQWCDFEWDKRYFPDVQGMLERYKRLGLKICVWINPYIAQGTAAFAEAAKNGFLLKRADGKGVRQLDTWQPGMGVVDFTNPAACEWYEDKLRVLLEQGVDCIKTDFGERIPIDVCYHDGSDPVAMHNYYTHLYNRCVFKLLEEVRGEGEAVLFARSATAGGQQFPAHWGGDSSASYASMAETLRGGLSLAMSGFAFWSHDISGFEATATPDLYKRWVQFGMLSSHSRLHGSTSYRVPWLFDEEACEVLRYFAGLKCRLMPYIFSASVEATHTGVPVMRPMVMDFCGDPAACALDMQYMLGGDLLVAPIFNDEGAAQYYLPEGRWTHLLSGEVREGGKWHKERYDYFSLPLFVRPGTLLPLGRDDKQPDYDYWQNIELHLYEPQADVTAACDIWDAKGTACVRVRVAMTEGEPSVRMEGGALTNCTLHIHENGAVRTVRVS